MKPSSHSLRTTIDIMSIMYWIVRHGLSRNQGMEIEPIVQELNQLQS